MSQSEIAQFREQQRLEETSARLGLEDLSAVASHEAITARMEQGAAVLKQLLKQGRRQEAYDLWNAGILEAGRTNGG